MNTAYFTHFGVPRFYAELAEPDAPAGSRRAPTAAAKLAQFGPVVAASFGIAALVTVGTLLLGYLIFGDACDSLIINNFAVNDRGERSHRLHRRCALFTQSPTLIT